MRDEHFTPLTPHRISFCFRVRAIWTRGSVSFWKGIPVLCLLLTALAGFAREPFGPALHVQAGICKIAFWGIIIPIKNSSNFRKKTPLRSILEKKSPLIYKTKNLLFRSVCRNLGYDHDQGGRTWQLFVGDKNGHESFRQARIYNFLVKCIVFAHNRKFADLTQ